MRPGLLATVLLGIASCGAPTMPIPEVDLWMRVEAPARPIVPGRGFDLRVARVWEKALTPKPFDPRALAPLVVQPLATSRREDKNRIEETQRFRAYAFVREDVTVRALPFVATRADGSTQSVRSARTTLRVTPALDAKQPGAPELPGPLPPEPLPLGWMVAAAVLLLVTMGAARSRRPRSGPAASRAPPATLHARIEAVRSQHDTLNAQVIALAAVLRNAVQASFGAPATSRTTEELCTLFPHPSLAAVLQRADAVKYGAQEATATDQAVVFEHARTLAREVFHDPP